MEENQKPLSESISSISQVDTPIQEGVETPTQKKSKAFPIIVVILLLLILGMGGYYVYKEYFAEKEIEVENPVPTDEEEEDPANIDVSEYTDIKLESYEGLNVSISDEMEEDGIIQGIVAYTRVLRTNPYSIEQMLIVNKKVLSEDQITQHYLPVFNDIKEKDLSASWLTSDVPWVLATTPSGTRHDAITEIEGIVYPNTDYTFALLSLEHGHGIASAGDQEDGNYRIQVYALKGDNIIGLSSEVGNLMNDLDFSVADDSKCSEVDEDTETDYLIYNEECLKEVFLTGRYDEAMKEIAEDLVTSFEIAN